MGRKEVLIQLSDELVEKLDAAASARGTSRSALVRDAVQRYIVHETEEEKDRRLVEGYTKFPPDHEWDDWHDQAAKDLFEEVDR